MSKKKHILALLLCGFISVLSLAQKGYMEAECEERAIHPGMEDESVESIEVKRYVEGLFDAYHASGSAASKTTSAGNNGSWSYFGPHGMPQAKAGNGWGSGTGKVDDMYIFPDDHDHILAGTSNGIWELDPNNGVTEWTNITRNSFFCRGEVRNITVHPTNPDIMYATPIVDNGNKYRVNFGVVKTVNGGETWSLVNNGIFDPGESFGMGDGYTPNDLEIDPVNPNILYFATHFYLYKTTNGGASWTKIMSAKSNTISTGWGVFSDVLIDATDHNTVYIGGTHIFKTTDGFSNFPQNTMEITSQMANHPIEWGAVLSQSPVDPNLIYVLYHYSNTGNCNIRMWLNSYNKQTGVKTSIGQQTDYTSYRTWSTQVNCIHEITTSDIDPSKVYVGGVSIGMYDGSNSYRLSEPQEPNGSTNWVHADIKEIIAFDDGNGNEEVFVAHDGGISRAINPGDVNTNSNDWELITEDHGGLHVFKTWGIGIVPDDPNTMIMGAHDMGLFYLEPGQPWKHFASGDGDDGVIDPTDPQRIYQTIPFSSSWYKSDDGGQTIYGRYGQIAWDGVIELDPSNPNWLYVGNGTHLRKYTDVRNSTTYSTILTVSRGEFRAFAVAPNNPSVMYAGASSHEKSSGSMAGLFYRSSDGGASWVDVGKNGLNGSVNGKISGMAINPYDENEIWVCFDIADGNDKVYHSTNGGSSWQALTVNFPSNLVCWDVEYDPIDDAVYAATSAGVYKCHMADKYWMSFNGNGCLPFMEVRDIELYTGHRLIRAAVWGGGIWESPLEFCPPDVHLNLSGTQSGGEFYGANQTITSSQSNSTNSDWGYRAGSRVKLVPGFKHTGAAEFFAKVKAPNCGNCVGVKWTASESELTVPYDPMTETTETSMLKLLTYPNPVVSSVMVELPPMDQEGSVSIVSSSGVVMKQFHTSESAFELHMEGWNPGVYILSVDYGGEQISAEILKQ